MDRLKLSLTGFVQVFFVAINTYFLSREFYIGVFIVGFLISLIWSWNVKKIAFGSLKDRLFYALGAGVGSLFGLIVSVIFFKNL
jgi:hypothetical protein